MSWQRLKKGDIVDIVATSHAASAEEIKQSAAYVRSLGLVPRVPEKLIGKDLFCANTDEKRFAFLYKALCAKDSAAVWCLRGGYGAARLMLWLEKAKKPAREKLLIGFSDITVLHLFLLQRWGWKPLHGPVLTPIARGVVSKETLRRLKALLFGAAKQATLEDLTPLNAAAKKTGSVNATLVGGNLSLLQTSLGTNWQLNTKGKILFVEEIDERPYRVDRMLTHLKQAGALDGVKAIIFGTFGNEATDAAMLKFFDQTVKRFAEEMPRIPMLKTEKIGHALENYPLPIGTKATLKLGKKPHLTAASGAK